MIVLRCIACIVLVYIIWVVLWFIIEKILSFMTCDGQTECYDERKQNGDLNEKGKCPGWVGGDIHSNYLSYTCIDCPYLDNSFRSESNVRSI